MGTGDEKPGTGDRNSGAVWGRLIPVLISWGQGVQTRRASGMFSQTYAWALRRLFKFVLKRALGRVLQNELNLEQLDVALG